MACGAWILRLDGGGSWRACRLLEVPLQDGMGIAVTNPGRAWSRYMKTCPSRALKRRVLQAFNLLVLSRLSYLVRRLRLEVGRPPCCHNGIRDLCPKEEACGMSERAGGGVDVVGRGLTSVTGRGHRPAGGPTWEGWQPYA